MLKKFYKQPGEEPRIVKEHPAQKAWFLPFFLGIIITVWGVIALLITRWNTTFSISFASNAWMYGLLCIFAGLIQRKINRLQEKRRLAAVWGDVSLRSLPQPHPVPPLLIPITIRYRPGWPNFYLYMLLMLCVFLFGAILFLFVTTSEILDMDASFLPVLTGSIMVISLLVVAGLLAIDILNRRSDLTINEVGLVWMEGLRSRVHTIHWKDARLFAIDSGIITVSTIVKFELASADEFIGWSWPLKKTFMAYFMLQPDVSAEEYNVIMHGLLWLIATNTSLPLYDLRDKALS